MGDRSLHSLVKKNSFYNSYQEQRSGICVRVNKEERTSPEKVQKDYHKMETIGKYQVELDLV